jgi:hypothetical protein
MNHHLEPLPASSPHPMAGQERLGEPERPIGPRGPARFRGNTRSLTGLGPSAPRALSPARWPDPIRPATPTSARRRRLPARATRRPRRRL